MILARILLAKEATKLVYIVYRTLSAINLKHGFHNYVMKIPDNLNLNVHNLLV